LVVYGGLNPLLHYCRCFVGIIRDEIFGVGGMTADIIGNSSELLEMLGKAEAFAPVPRPLIIRGERGTGKEMLAQFIHGRSACSAGPFIAVNCAVFNDELLTSELFGHEKGAFTGAVSGENKAKANIADYEAELAVKEAAAQQTGEVAKRQAQVELQKAQYLAEQERLNAEEIVLGEIEKRKIEIAADAEAERTRREAKGEADGVLFKYEAEAEGIQKLLDGKAAGYESLVNSCAGDAKAAATLLMIEKIEDIVKHQVEAIRNLKIDKITVWDSAGGEGRGSSTANFASSLIKSLPPLQEIAAMAGVELPSYLGKMVDADQPLDLTEESKKPAIHKDIPEVKGE